VDDATDTRVPRTTLPPMSFPGAAHPAHHPGHQPPAPAHVVHPRRPGAEGAALWVTVAFVLGLCALVTIGFIGISTGPVGAGVGLLLALLPVYPVAASLLWLDRLEAEPWSLLLFAAVWGGTAAVVMSLFFSLGAVWVTGASEAESAVVVAPVVEEVAKGLAIVGVLLIRRREFDGVVDGIVYAGMAGLGFAFVENVLYLGSAFLDGGVPGALATFVGRGVMGPFAHPMFTAAFGIGVGLAVRTRNPLARVAYPLVGLVAAMGLHALWNYLSLTNFLVGYVLVQVPIFAGFVTFAVLARRREARLVARHLQPYVTSGWLTPVEHTMLSSSSGRRQAREWASRTAGRSGRAAMQEFQGIASELAFLRERMEHGAARPDAQQSELDMLQTMWQLRSGFLPAVAR
jgi:RsiW-degrading membrane proteinase PrsW (M82 family)